MNNQPMDFIVDKETKTVTITKELDAGLTLVWDAYTKPELLDQWWAPKPWASRTKAMDFKVGGRRFYAMVGPEGNERWAVQKYTSITPKSNFKIFNAFADAEENLELPGSDWDLNFIEQDGTNGLAEIAHHVLIRLGFRNIFGPNGGREHAHAHRLLPVLARQGVEKLPAVHNGHVQVEQNQVGQLGGLRRGAQQRVESWLAVDEGLNPPKRAVPVQVQCRDFGSNQVVLNDVH